MKTKAQVSTEFIFALGIVLFVFLVVIAVAFQKNVEVRDTDLLAKLQNECHSISNMIISVFFGTSDAEYTIQKTRVPYDFSIDSPNRLLTLSNGDTEFSCTLPFNEILNANGQDIFDISKGNISIIKTEGTLIINAST